MKKPFFTLIIALGFLIIALIAVFATKSDIPENDPVVTTPESSPKNIAYEIEGVSYILRDGKSEQLVTGEGATKSTVILFSEPVYGDLDNDGDIDAAVLLVSDGGGSGAFYYAALARSTSYGYQSTNALFLGDRIAPQTIEIHDGRAVYNYAERRADEPMTAQPSMGKSLWIHLDPKKNEIGEFVKDFEGEADPERMSLTMKPWTWLRTEYADGTIFVPRKTDAFTITLKDEGSFSATTDCNSMGGSYQNTVTSLTFSEVMSTLMYCENSDEANFAALLGEIRNYRFTSKGELLLDTDMGLKTAIFR